MEKERKQGFFAALKEEVVRGLSPARSRGKSPARSASPGRMLIPRRRKEKQQQPPPEKLLQQYFAEPLISRSGSLRPGGEALAPLIEGPDRSASPPGDFAGGEESARRRVRPMGPRPAGAHAVRGVVRRRRRRQSGVRATRSAAPTSASSSASWARRWPPSLRS